MELCGGVAVAGLMASASSPSALDKLQALLAEPDTRLSKASIIAMASVAGALLLRSALGSFADEAQFITFFPAVVLTALLTGIRGGIIAMILSAAAWWFLVQSSGWSPTAVHLIPLTLFVLLSGVLILAVGAMRIGFAQAHSMRESLETRVRERTRELEASQIALEDITKDLEKLVARRTEELEESRNVLGSVLEGLPDAVYLLEQQDGELRFAYINSAAEAFLGRSRTEIIGRMDKEVISPEHALENRQVLESGQPLWVPQRALATPDGERSLEIRKLLLGFSYREASLLTIIRDVTDWRELQASLRQTYRVDALGQLTGGIAHDFNNLLAIAIGNLDQLEDNAILDPDALELLGDARNACLSGAELTARLLAFARKQTLNPVATNVNELITDYAKLLGRLLGADIILQLHLAPDVWTATVDKAQLEAAITNLATNARDAMPKGGKLTISTHNETLDRRYTANHPDLKPGPYVAVEVTDSGEGMTPKILEKAVEPFFTTKEEGRGTGLGLSMVFGFAKQSGGHVRIYSEPGQGTTVTLLLPRAEVDRSEKQDETTGSRGAETGETVLVVEDNASLRRVAISQLSSLGYEVLEAEDGPSALEVLGGERRIDLLLTDIVMPGGLNGVDLGKAARQLRPHLKLIYMSGFPETAFGDRAVLEPGITLLRKPFRKAELAARLRGALDQQSSSR